MYEKALAIRKAMLPAVHPDTASTLNDLAGLYYKALRVLEETWANRSTIWQAYSTSNAVHRAPGAPVV